MPHFIRIHEYIRQFRVGDAASAARFRELVLAALENRRKEFATEIAELDDDEKVEFLQDLGMEEPGLDLVMHSHGV